MTKKPHTEGEHVLASVRAFLSADFDIVDKRLIPPKNPDGSRNAYHENGFILVGTGALLDNKDGTPRYADKAVASRAADAAAGKYAAKNGFEVRREADDSVAWHFRYSVV
jgi:hypothetical protein